MVRWLDVHNLAGILLVAWTLAVGFTGVINTWADLVLKMWQFGQLAELTSVDTAIEAAAPAVPGMTLSFVAFPGTIFSSKATTRSFSVAIHRSLHGCLSRR